MTLNFPGPWVIDFTYTLSGLEHHQSLNCLILGDPEPGDSFDEIVVASKGGGYGALDARVDEYVAIWQELMSSAVSFVEATLYKITPESFERTWYSTYTLGLVGTGTGSAIPASEMIFTFRTLEGGLMKINIEEGNRASGISIAAGALTGTEADFVAYVVSDDGWFLGRDTSYPIAALYLHPGQNEAIFKARYRS